MEPIFFHFKIFWLIKYDLYCIFREILFHWSRAMLHSVFQKANRSISIVETTYGSSNPLVTGNACMFAAQTLTVPKTGFYMWVFIIKIKYITDK